MTTSTRGTAKIPAVLVLEDGRTFRGRAYGAVGETFGEAVFSTGVRDPARVPSNWRSVRSLDEELREQGVVGISGVDTRALTRHLRERGAMRVGIFSGNALPDEGTMLAEVRQAPEMKGANLSAEVATKEAYVVPAIGEKRFTVAAVDLGIKGMTP
ncbi:carbamoyl-phosphate synthase domain-containing protein, partial [Streptomyces chattanoogensis]